MSKFDGGLGTEIVFSKIDNILRDRCCDGKISEEELEKQLDKVELMNYTARKKYLERLEN